MKKQMLKLVKIILLFYPAWVMGQSPADVMFDKYSGQDGFTSVYITQHMFSLFADVETAEDESSFLDLVKNLKSIKILSMDYDSTRTVPVLNFSDEIKKGIQKSRYEELMVIKKKDQDINFYILQEGKKISELLMVVSGSRENTLITIQGDIDLKTISKLSQSMNIEGMENLEEIK